jgi:hypothetical protein
VTFERIKIENLPRKKSGGRRGDPKKTALLNALLNLPFGEALKITPEQFQVPFKRACCAEAWLRGRIRTGFPIRQRRVGDAVYLWLDRNAGAASSERAV